jgi:hypothetical protein
MRVNFTRKRVIFARLRVDFFDTRACRYLSFHSTQNLLLCFFIPYTTPITTLLIQTLCLSPFEAKKNK